MTIVYIHNKTSDTERYNLLNGFSFVSDTRCLKFISPIKIPLCQRINDI